MTGGSGGVLTCTNMDVVVIGGGIAGMSVALTAPKRDVTLVTKESLDESSTRYAQGGIAAALALPDTPELHFADTVVAGAGLCDEDALRILVDEAPERIGTLLLAGARFDRKDGELALAREGGHSMARILHAGGDATGAELQRLLGDYMRESGVDLIQDCRATDLLIVDGRCTGVRVIDFDGDVFEIQAGAVVLATGGAGALYDVTTNPDIATADGLAMALRAGAVVADLEFVQFHPTALVVEARPRPLVSEAVRGEGALLRAADGRRIMEGMHPLEDLAPRDVVAQTVFRSMLAANSDHVFLDATSVADFAHRFPTITALCKSHGLDPRVDWLPVAPAAHYNCGGVVTDLVGRTSVPGLYACGEVACTGVHGGNRLASNSLLEGLVFGSRLGETLNAGDDQLQQYEGAARYGRDVCGPFEAARVSDEQPASTLVADAIPRLRRLMTRNAGVVRTADSLTAALSEIEMLTSQVGAGRRAGSLDNLLVVSEALTRSALYREESRGCHVRDDFPERRPEWAKRLYQRRGPDGRAEVFW